MKKKNPLEVFHYEVNREPDSISEEEGISFESFSKASNKNNKNNKSNKNNKRKFEKAKRETPALLSNSRETKKQKKVEEDTSSLSEDDGFAIINSGKNNNSSGEMSEVDYLLRRLDSDQPQRFSRSEHTSSNDSLNRIRKLKASIAQTQNQIAKTISIDLIDQNSEEEDDSVVKIILTCVELKKQYTFSVKRAQKFQLLSDKLSSIIGVPSNQIQFRLYQQDIDLKKCPDDYGLVNNEKLTVTTIKAKFCAEIQNDSDHDDEFKKELEKKLLDVDLPLKDSKTDNKNSGKITLHVVIPSQTKHLKFKILPTEKFEKIIEAIYSETGKKIKLQFDGETLPPKSTPQEYEMEGGEQIDAKFV